MLHLPRLPLSACVAIDCGIGVGRADAHAAVGAIASDVCGVSLRSQRWEATGGAGGSARLPHVTNHAPAAETSAAPTLLRQIGYKVEP
jgi:hypothetical protein